LLDINSGCMSNAQKRKRGTIMEKKSIAEGEGGGKIKPLILHREESFRESNEERR